MTVEMLKKTAAFALEQLKAFGADDAQCRINRTLTDEINADAGEFSLMRSTFNSTVTLTAIKDGKKGVISVNKLEKDALIRACEDCVKAAEDATRDDCVSISQGVKSEDFSCGTGGNDRDRFFERIREYLSDISAMFPKVVVEQLIADYYETKIVLMNTNGVVFSNSLSYYSAGAMYLARDGEKSTSFNSTGIDFYTLDERIIDKGAVRQMFAMCEKELEATAFEGKFTGTAVFAPSCINSIVGAAVSNFTGDGALIEGTSPWKDKLGKKVASESLSVTLIPVDDRIVGAERFTSEGYRSENGTIIENGVLKSFTLSEYAARKTGQKRCSTLSGCMEISSGEKSIEEIISGIKQGILVCRVSGGMPAQNGDFSAVAKNSFLIENGKITRPVLETMISANLADMLENIIDISSETTCDGCDVLPYIAFDGVTVSGK